MCVTWRVWTNSSANSRSPTPLCLARFRVLLYNIGMKRKTFGTVLCQNCLFCLKYDLISHKMWLKWSSRYTVIVSFRFLNDSLQDCVRLASAPSQQWWPYTKLNWWTSGMTCNNSLQSPEGNMGCNDHCKNTGGVLEEYWRSTVTSSSFCTYDRKKIVIC